MKSNPHFVLDKEINIPLKFTLDGLKKKPLIGNSVSYSRFRILMLNI